jgi:mannosylglycoprotein endo-beta-mannosidase
MEAFETLWRGDFRGLHVANQALITLLPKRADAVEVKDFRPISLIHSVAKLVAKVLSSRLAPHMPSIVGPHQSAFIRGRCLHDNFQLVQATARKLHRLKTDAILLKLDITKAFDTVDWAFLLDVLTRLGFGRIWTSMVCGILGTASTRVLVNGVAGDLIYNQRGLRQGDPLSPLLFDSVMDVLHLMIEKAVAVGLLSELARTGLRHRTSMYADDVVTFFRPTYLDLHTCSAIVEDFGVASGLRTNLAKCSLHPIRCSPEQVELARGILGCEVAPFPCKYLGLPLSIRKVTAAQLQPVVDNAVKRLQPWCAKLMNRGGRTILVQTTLSAMIVHAMMSLDVPPKALEAFTKICRAFLWKGRREVNGGHCLVAWEKVTSPKCFGGLGIPNLHLLNLALRCRWAWLQWTDPTRAWAEFDLQLPRLSVALFDAATVVQLGNGEKARFWSDRWLDGAKVEDIAPNLTAAVPARKVKVRTVKEGLSGTWLRDCGPDLGEAALAEFFILWQVLAGVQLTPGREDTLRWCWSEDGVYSAKSAYNAFFAGRARYPAASVIWRSRAPYGCKFFAWVVSRDRCWTADRLERRRLPRPVACPLCDQEPETIQHLLVGCVVARQVWAWALNLWDRMAWLPLANTGLLLWWTSRPCPKATQRDLWTAIILVFWCIWRHRNDVVFNGATPEVGAILARIREDYSRWRQARLFRSDSFGLVEPLPLFGGE